MSSLIARNRAADDVITSVIGLTASEANMSRREVEQLVLSKSGRTSDREQRAKAVLDVRSDLGLDDNLLQLASDISAAERRELAAKGHALPDGSYPIPDAEHLRAAAILCRSKHGDWRAAQKLIARRARELGVTNPLDASQDDDSVQTSNGDNYLAREIDSYVRRYPPYDSEGNRLCLTDTGQPLSEIDAAGEVARITMTYEGPRLRFNNLRAIAQSALGNDNLILSQREREHDDAQLIRCTSQADIDDYILHLTTGTQGQRAFGLAAPSRTDIIDAGAPAVSDTSGRVALRSQNYYASAAFSPKAQAQMDALPPVYRSSITADLAAADAAEDPDSKSHFVARARDTAYAAGAVEAARELLQRIRALGDSASTIPDAAAAAEQSARTMTACQVAAEVDRLSSMTVADSTGSRTDPPKSPAQRETAEAAARPGHTSRVNDYGRSIPQLHRP